MLRLHIVTIAGCLFAGAPVAGCSSPIGAAAEVDGAIADRESTDPFAERADDITEGGPSLFPWAVRITTSRLICTGALIAPRVVLTAAHCILDGSVGRDDVAEFNLPDLSPVAIRAYARFRDARGVVHTGLAAPRTIDLEQHDIGVAILERPVYLTRYPQRSLRRELTGLPVYGVGRIAHEHGRFRETPLDDLEPLNDRYYRVRRGMDGDYLEPGDSGGPWVAAWTERVIGVSSGRGGRSIIARLDAVRCWIAQQVDHYGGEGPQGRSMQRPPLETYCP